MARNTIKGDSKYYLREIKNLFVAGQTYPVTEVPGPHSRKITNTIKFRLQNIAHKLLQKSAGERLKISRLMKYFPDQNELQMRQRLKVIYIIPFSWSVCLYMFLRSKGIHGVSSSWTASRILEIKRLCYHSF